jgi:uncharacterized protein (DUF1330 family)
MAAYVVVQIDVKDAETYERYKAMAPPSIGQYGGRYIVRGAPTVILEGAWQPKRLVILEFPDREAAQAWWSSPEYAEAKRLRQSCTDTEMLLVDGIDAPVL